MSMSNYEMIYVTCSSMEEATEIGRTIVKTGLAACANILPQMKSIYNWNDKIFEEDEVVLLLKTHQNKFKEINKAINELHSYDVPCIISIPIENGDAKYLDWIAKNLI